MSDALMQRLETFLGKLAEKQAETFREAEAGFAGLREEFPEDPMPMGNALQGIRAQMFQLGQRVDEVWEQQIEKLFSAQAPAALDRAIDRKEDAKRELDGRWRTFEAKVQADFYRALHPRAVAALAQPVPCARCSAVLSPSGVRRTTAITCPACGAVAQVAPLGPVGQYFGGAGHAFAEEAAMPQRLAIEARRVAVDRQRRAASWAPESMASLEEWERLEQGYWDTYGRVRASVTGDPVDAEFVKSRMDAFRKFSLETDQRWRKHRGL